MPCNFTKEENDTLMNIFEKYSLLLSEYFSDIAKMECTSTVTRIEEHSFESLYNDSENYCITGFFNFGYEPMSISQYLATVRISSRTAFMLIERMSGGPGERFKMSRNFSKIEKLLMTCVTKKLIELIKISLSDYAEISPSFIEIETDKYIFKRKLPNLRTISVPISVHLGECIGTVTVSIPIIYIKKIMDTFKNFRTVNISKTLNNLPVTIRAVYPDIIINTEELLNLQKGDIISLDTNISNHIDILVNEKLSFKAFQGKRNGKHAIKITDVAESEE